MNKQEHFLTVFAEELGELATELLELQKQIFKAQRFGIDEQRDLPTTNRQRIEAEWSDLLGSMVKLKSVGINLMPDLDAIALKVAKIDQYTVYAEQLGTVYFDDETTLDPQSLELHFSNVEKVKADGIGITVAYSIVDQYGNRVDQILYAEDGSWFFLRDNFPSPRRCFQTTLPIKTVQQLLNEAARAGLHLTRQP